MRMLHAHFFLGQQLDNFFTPPEFKICEANLFIIVKSRSRHAYSKKLHAQLFPRAKVGAIKVFWIRLRQKNAGLLKLRRQHLGVCSNFCTNTHTHMPNGRRNKFVCRTPARFRAQQSFCPFWIESREKGNSSHYLVAATLIFEQRLCCTSWIRARHPISYIGAWTH